MKRTLTLKRIAAMLFCIPLFTINANAALTHGSIMGIGVPMYAQHNNAAATTLVPGLTLDYKVVTIAGKSWAWTDIHGSNIGGANWSSQFRYYSSTLNKTENNLESRVTGSTTQTYGSTTKTIPAAPLKITFFQDANGFNETDFIPYDVTAKNSAVGGDVTAPVLSSAVSSDVTETSAKLTLAGSDDSGNLFYYISGNGVSEVSFLPTITVSGLTASSAYTLTVTPIDFTGNEGTSSNVSFTTGGLVQITSGIAQDIKFALKSTTTKLEYYYEFTDPTKKFRDAFLKITPAGGTEFEIKPTLSPDSTYAYGVLDNDVRTNGKILSLNCGYMIYKPVLDWGEYVVANTNITSGALSGTPIKHQMGSGPSPAETEATAPSLTSATLKDVNANYIKLNINGSDNSGTVYYTISGAKSTVNAFRTGDYYLTEIEPGKTYNLSLQPYDLSGNTAAAQTLTVKTMPARTNINDGNLMKYNTTLISSTGAANELAANIVLAGNSLTLGCNTTNAGLTGTQLNRKFFDATVKVDGVSYPLTLATPDSTSAQFTFNETIGGSKTIAAGKSFTIQFSVYWTKNAGNFYTGTFTYTIGDNGQVDVTGPTTPALTLSGSSLTWPACTDDLSGVKSYLVSETGQTPVTVFDLGETSFSYTMINPAAVVTVKAQDFVGNYSALASKNDVGTGNEDVLKNSLVVYPNPANDQISITGDVREVSLYSLQGQLVLSAKNVNTLNISSVTKGLYVVKVTNKSGNIVSSKLEIR